MIKPDPVVTIPQSISIAIDPDVIIDDDIASGLIKINIFNIDAIPVISSNHIAFIRVETANRIVIPPDSNPLMMIAKRTDAIRLRADIVASHLIEITISVKDNSSLAVIGDHIAITYGIAAYHVIVTINDDA